MYLFNIQTVISINNMISINTIIITIILLLLSAYSMESTHSDFQIEEIKTLEQHTDEVKCLAQLTNELIASGSKDTTINIWNIKTGILVRILSGHTGHVTSLASLDNNQLASSSSDSTIRIWNIQTGETLRQIEDPVTSLVSLKDGRLASGSRELIHIWDIETGFQMNTIQAHDKNVLCLALLLKFNLLASGSSDKTIKLWDLYTFELKMTLVEHESVITTLVVLPNNLLASGSWDNTIRLWNVTNNEKLVQTIQHDQMYAIRSLASFNDGIHLGSGSFDFSDSNIYLWNSKDGSLSGTLNGHSDVINALIVMSNDYLISGSSDKTIKIWKRIIRSTAKPITVVTTINVATTTSPITTNQFRLDFSKNIQISQSTTSLTVENQIETTAEMQTFSSQSVSCMKLKFRNYIAYFISILLSSTICIKWLVIF